MTIPTSTHASINLAQAVLVALYELHVAAGDATRPMGRHRKHAPAASAQQLELTFADMHRSLEAMDFFRTRNPEHVMRSTRSMRRGLISASPTPLSMNPEERIGSHGSLFMLPPSGRLCIS